MKGNKKAKFFCENCGSEVPENARVCKKCGKFFISVRCPKCGATGSNDDFLHGCPQCGYAVNGAGVSSRSKDSDMITSDKQKKRRVFFEKDHKTNSSGNPNGETSLPLWVYVFTASAFFVVVCIVYGCIRM